MTPTQPMLFLFNSMIIDGVLIVQWLVSNHDLTVLRRITPARGLLDGMLKIVSDYLRK